MHFRAFLIVFVVITLTASLYDVPNSYATTDTFDGSQAFGVNGLWTVPDGVTSISVEVWGSGGGGGGSASVGGGGGGGAYSQKTLSVTPGNFIEYNIGRAGVGTTPNGGNGGSTWFSNATTVFAEGGSGAVGGVSGAGGLAANGFGDTKYSGGSGGTGSIDSNAGYGGGSSAGTGSNGADAINGAGGVAPSGGGNGGAGGGTGLSGSSGATPGGGGGGGGLSAASGPGGVGRVSITYAGADTTAPTITNVTSDKANGTYTVGEVIDIDVTFSEAVTSTGNVTVTLETGTTDRTCTFTATSSTTGTCNYTVQAGDLSADLTVGTISGTIDDAAGNDMTNFVPATNLAANKALVIDTNAPTITNVTSDKANGTYTVGEVIDIDVTFSEAVTSTGNVTVTLETGTTDRTCTFTATSSTTGTCNYTVQAGDLSADLTVSTISGTIDDAAGNDMTNFVPATNLAANKALVIDTTGGGGGDTSAPELLTFTSTTSDGTYGPGSSIVIVATYNEALGSDSVITVTLDNGKKIPLSTVSGETLTGKYVVGATGSTESSDDLTIVNILSESVYDTSDNFRTNSGVPENSHNLGDRSDIVIDTLAPTASILSPADNSTNVSGGSNFVITFNEEVTANVGNILIKRYPDNAIAATIGVATSQVTGVGTNTITINPNSTLANGTGYYILVPNRAFKDRYGNFFTGFYAKTTWNFTTTGYLAASSFSPPDNSKDVDTSSDFVITFNKPVFVSRANILIKRTSNNSTVAAINATSTQVTGSGTDTITINPNKNLVINTEYYVQIPATAFKDSGNNFYAGFTDKTIWNFTTGTGPAVSSFSPADNATDVNISTNLVLIFNKPVFVSRANILIKRTSNNSTVAAINATSTQVTGSGTDTITINPKALLPESTGLYIQIPATAFRDSKGNFYAGFTDKTIWNFVTNARPAIVLFSPADNATDVDVEADLVITFHKIVTVQTGNILIVRLDNDDIVESIDVTSLQLTGSGTKTITINPNTDLAYGTNYYIQIPATAFRDSKGNFFGGVIRNTDWDFATACSIWDLFCTSRDRIASPTPDPVATPTPEESNPTPNPEPTPTPSPDDLPIDTPIVKIITFIKKIIAFVKESIVSPRTALPRIQKALKMIMDYPIVKAVTAAVTVAAVASVAASAGILIFGAPTLLSEVSQALRRIWQGILSFFGFNRKQRPWGRVLDAETGNAIPGASIQIYDHQAKQLKDTTLSNDRGAFSLVVPPGVYEFRVQKSGWVLTPKAPFLQLVAGEHIFDGKPVEVTKTRILPIVLAMRMTESVPIARHLLWRRAFQVIEFFIARLSWPLLVFGVALNSFAVIVVPTKINIAIEILYAVLITWKIFLHFLLKPSVGLVQDATTGKPLDLAVVRLYDAKNSRLVETRTTSHNGTFLLLPPLGVYTIMVVCSGYEPYRESHVVVDRKRESLALSFLLKKLP